MAIRIVGVDLPQNKRGEIALTYIYGIGRSAANSILSKAGIDRDIKVKDWTDDQSAKVREIISTEYKVEGDLRTEIQLNIKRLMDIGCYRGIRHRIGLPVRGQSTKIPGRRTLLIRERRRITEHSILTGEIDAITNKRILIPSTNRHNKRRGHNQTGQKYTRQPIQITTSSLWVRVPDSNRRRRKTRPQCCHYTNPRNYSSYVE